MTNDLEKTLRELPAGCRDVVARLRASAEVSPRAVAVGRWRPVPLATAAALAAALLGVAAFFASDRASETRQLKGPREYVLAAQPSADAVLEIVRLQKADGSWQKEMETYCGYGRNGLKAWNERHEGDQTTPVGSFPILHAFGISPNPGTQMSWRDVTPNSYWSGEQATYNTWVESATPISGEHLSEYTICYKYAMAVGFNVNPTVYKRGSAIFLHCKNPADWGSAGCVSVEEADMIALLQQCHNGCYMMIVPNEASIANF